MGILCFNYSLYYSFITPEEIEKIKEIRPSKTKAFKDITDKELQDESIDWALTIGVTSNSIQYIRFKLGYSTKAKIVKAQTNILIDFQKRD
ncbi:MAG: hypothetical protein ACQEWW_23325 [Bacillota bacterium]